VGANATIIAGVTVGRYAFVGSGSVVTKDVPTSPSPSATPQDSEGSCAPADKKCAREEREWECQFCGRRFKKVSDEKIEEV
jgi:UDP-2-acetamido-3-amino-2,3-dideoxy-glucuronate N-acetyltransferase